MGTVLPVPVRLPSKLREQSVEAMPGDGADRFAGGGAFPLAVEDLLRTSLELRDRYEHGNMSAHGLRSATGRVGAKRDRMLEIHYRNPANRGLARHLEHERPWLFTFPY